MTVQELIDHLMKIEDKTLLVAVEADHGQVPMESSWVGEVYVEDKTEYMMESMFEEDDKGNPLEIDDEHKIIVIQAY